MSTKAEEEQKLAKAHYEAESEMVRIFRINGVTGYDGKPDSDLIGLLEVNNLTASLGVKPLHFGPNLKKGYGRPSVIVEITPEEYEMLEAGELALPEGWTVGDVIPDPRNAQAACSQDEELIERVIREYARIFEKPDTICPQMVFDRQGGHYLLMIMGRNGAKRVHDCLIHVDIIKDKFWIQHDDTKYGVARELMDAGVPKDRIVLGFRTFEDRAAGEFAVA